MHLITSLLYFFSAIRALMCLRLLMYVHGWISKRVNKRRYFFWPLELVHTFHITRCLESAEPFTKE
jgi:hypothetical protein